MTSSTPKRLVTIELDPSWADEHMDCYACSYPITDWDDVVAVPTSIHDGDPPSGAAFIHRICPIAREVENYRARIDAFVEGRS